MAILRDILDSLEQLAPARYAFPGDRIGLQVGDPSASVSRVAVSLDSSPDAARFAQEIGAQLLLSHHPLIWDPLKHVRTDQHPGSTLGVLLGSGIAFVGAHTNWDAAPGGVNDTLAELLGLEAVERFGYANPTPQFKLVTFVPHRERDLVIDALSAAGAGVIGEYERCAFVSPGSGTFFPGAGANPAIGEVGVRAEVEESRLEMLVPGHLVEPVRAALQTAHPYEEPAYDFLVLEPNPGMQAGRIGLLPAAMTLRDFSRHVDSILDIRSWTWGAPDRPVRRVAVVGGAADGEWESARRAGADVFVTGEIKQNVAVDACAADFPVVAAGHYATEHPGMVKMAREMGRRMPEVDWRVFAPESGHAGRPW
ncbi:MAG: Nif3-like dinuclear metal center hexameric protein [Fimbriimonadaceae bacterium]|nr:Nif3-like dinuclear metal center hexameric protein [Fimbriimonadaceae bacterium]